MKEKESHHEYRTKEMSRKTGVPASKLYYYEDEGLLTPRRTENGYRLYTDSDIERLFKILLLRKYDVEIKDIRKMLDDPAFDLNAEIQKRVKLQQERAQKETEELEGFSRAIALTGCLPESASLSTENLPETADFIEKHWNLGNAVSAASDHIRLLPQLFEGINEVIAKFSGILDLAPESAASQELAEELCRNINEFFLKKMSLRKIAEFLSQIFCADGMASRDVDSRNGKGTAKMMGLSLRVYAERKAEQEKIKED